MMDYRTREHLNRQATRQAQRDGKLPALIEQEDLDAYLSGDESAICIPYIGDRTPRGYRRVGDPMFVDTSGWGSEGEPALTILAFVRSIKPSTYWGLVEFGQFQGYVQQFEKVDVKAANRCEQCQWGMNPAERMLGPLTSCGKHWAPIVGQKP